MQGYVISLNPLPQEISLGQLGKLIVSGAKPDGTPVATPIPDRISRVDKGADVFEAQKESGMAIATDIAQRYADKGLYASETPTMSPEVLVMAREQFTQACIEKVMHADGMWEKFHRRDLIPDESRMAARWIGAKPEWLDPTSGNSEECPFCAERIQPGAKKCRYCGETLNAAEYARLKAELGGPPALTSVAGQGGVRKGA